MLTYDQISREIIKALKRANCEIDSKQIHTSVAARAPVTAQRLSVVLARMCREGLIVSSGKKARLLFRLGTMEDQELTVSDAMRDKMEIYAWRPLVSAPKVAPMREIPAWSRQPL